MPTCCAKINVGAARRSAALSRRATIAANRAARRANRACPSGGCKPVKPRKPAGGADRPTPTHQKPCRHCGTGAASGAAHG